MIKAIIFDCFGVLVGDSLSEVYEKFLANDSAKIQQSNKWLDESNNGEITYIEFVNNLATLANATYDQINDMLENNPRNEPLLDYIRFNLMGNYKIGMLSNASDDWIDKMFTKEDLELFESILLSYKIGFAKPEARAYELAASELGVRLDECVFTDDREAYIEGAQRVGMKALLFKDTEQFKVEFKELLG